MNIWVPLISRRVVLVTGKEGRDLLQGISTNDINLLGNQKGIFTAFLNRQGRFLADAFVFQNQERLYLEYDSVHHSVIMGLIHKYGPLHGVQVKEVPWAVISFSGSESAFLYQKIQDKIQEYLGIIFQDFRHPSLGFRVALPYEYWHEIPTPLCIPGTETSYRTLCIQNGVPSGAHDLVYERSLILEYQYHFHQGISWKKGCYVGQEVIASSFYQNRVHKSLFYLTHIQGERVPSVGEAILDFKGNVQGRWGYIQSGHGLICLEQAWGLECLNSGHFQCSTHNGEIITGTLVSFSNSFNRCDQGANNVQ
ncbi:putative transferase CAF17, mitochondrial [Holospora obtusa F1]|uniref:Transferase CAF17, mitochondrial n=1 Tax=Holospora obtusa F1 TaxID=1399147 RepID=W6TTE2_HOLOB|nr:hypothetical protein [Holospora obtusa]ETZ07052.1 putative transferase CAF17, mitochondrial [Holospora obtusa F1]